MQLSWVAPLPLGGVVQQMGSWLAPPTLLHLRTPTASSPHRTRRQLSMLAAAYRAETATAETATAAAPAAAAAAAAGAASYSNRPPQPSSPLLPCLRGHRTAHSAPPTLAQIRERTANEHHQCHHAVARRQPWPMQGLWRCRATPRLFPSSHSLRKPRKGGPTQTSNSNRTTIGSDRWWWHRWVRVGARASAARDGPGSCLRA